jgi:hypothetical protein
MADGRFNFGDLGEIGDYWSGCAMVVGCREGCWIGMQCAIVVFGDGIGARGRSAVCT